MSPCPAWGQGKGLEGALGEGTAGLGDPLLLSLAGGQAPRVPGPSSTHSSGFHWQLEQTPGRPDTSLVLI